MDKKAQKQIDVVAWVLAALVIVVTVLGVWWLFWLLWCAVLSGVWPTGPQGLISPGYWLFLGGSVLLGLVARFIRRK